jgi:PGF-CTERM protein
VDGNDDDRIDLAANTHLLGRNAPFDDHALPYWTERGLWITDAADNVESVDVEEAPGGDYPLPVGEYDLTLRADDETLATSTLTVTDPSVAGLGAYVGPSDTITNATPTSLRTAAADGTLTANGTVLNGSALIYEIQSASLFGPLWTAASGYAGPDRYAQAFLDTATDRNDSAVPGDVTSFDISGPSNTRVDLQNTFRQAGLVTVPDRENGTLYVGLRTDRLAVANGTALGSGDRFTANFGVYDQTASEAVQFADGTDDDDRTPEQPSPETPATPDQTTSPSPDTGDTPSPETAAPPADDPTEQSPDATTTADGPGFGVAAVVAAVLAVSALAVGRRRD